MAFPFSIHRAKLLRWEGWSQLWVPCGPPPRRFLRASGIALPQQMFQHRPAPLVQVQNAVIQNCPQAPICYCGSFSTSADPSREQCWGKVGFSLHHHMQAELRDRSGELEEASCAASSKISPVSARSLLTLFVTMTSEHILNEGLILLAKRRHTVWYVLSAPGSKPSVTLEAMCRKLGLKTTWVSPQG